jgi:beta-glucanase (GH16 family)
MQASQTSVGNAIPVDEKPSRRRRYVAPGAIAVVALIASLAAGISAPVAGAAPASAAATPSAVTAVAGSRDAAVTWKAPSKEGGSVTGYYVTAHRGSLTSKPKWFAGTSTKVTMTGLTNGTGYQFTVAAANAGGTGSPSTWSNYITPTTVPGVPKKVSATANGGGATLWWAAAHPTLDPTTAYLVTPYVDGKALAPRRIGSTVTAQTLIGLNDGTSYRFTVRAVNAIGDSAPSALTNPITAVKDPTTFDDRFTGPAGSNPNVGLAKPVWNFDRCWSTGCGNGSDAEYLRSNTYQDGHGDLVLRATDKPTNATCGSKRCDYTGAGLDTYNSQGSSTFSQKYGTFTARIKLPSGSGLWPSFWLEGSNDATAGWPVCGEIDALEADGSNASTVQQHIHYGHTNTQIGSGWQLPAGQSTAGWHNYSITWSPAGIVWKVDGRSTMAVLASTVGAKAWTTSFSHPFSLILDLTVGGTYVSRPKASSFTAKMLVDYLQVTKS